MYNLMLCVDVVKVVEKGEFYIWVIDYVIEVIEIFIGKLVGVVIDDGSYLVDIVFGFV